MSPEPASWSPTRVGDAFESLGEAVKARVRDEYEGRRFEPGGAEVDRHLRQRRGSAYDLEVSIDETTAPTLPSHHLFIATELARLGVAVTSMAPRFVGEFQKGIDYIGGLGGFEEQFQVHCAIARGRGGYRMSIHSGSDKFSVYPAIARHTGMRPHLKTAGTSWLETYLEKPDSRQVLHIGYGVLLADSGIQSALYTALRENEEKH